MKILVIAPHADDEVLGVGGTIGRFVSEGHQVDTCIVTSGHSSMYTGDQLSIIRKEAVSAHAKLGINKTFFLDFPAVLLSEVPKVELNSRLSDIIHQVNPEILFIPHFGDMHLDHYLVAQSAMVAGRPNGNQKIKKIYSYETLSETEWNTPHSSSTFIPNTYVDISLFLDLKLECMKIYSSQLKNSPHPRSLDSIKALATYRGSTIGTQAAEAFSLLRCII